MAGKRGASISICSLSEQKNHALWGGLAKDAGSKKVKRKSGRGDPKGGCFFLIMHH